MSVKFAFIGGTSRGFKLIETLLQKNHVPEFAVVLKEDDHEVEKYSINISDLLKENQIPFSIKKKLADADYTNIKESNLDFIIVSGWRTLIDTKVIEHVKFGLIAAHQSLLPKYRGFAPTQWAIINGETETGVTLFLIEDGETDSGRIIGQKVIPIEDDEYAIDLDNKIVRCTTELILEFIDNYKNDKITFREQDESKATYTCKRIPEDGRIDWTRSSAEVYNLIRALAHPFPGAFCYYKEECYHIRKASPGESNLKIFSGCIPGRVIKISKSGIEVLCGTGTLLIAEWENKSPGVISNPSETIKSISATLK
ncbi:MAG: methionyl-tRNA formyltransferase [Ignavibacteria bacterium]|nr:methionyl-tRNA formyltransferase [Ignavibacteria bacterium]